MIDDLILSFPALKNGGGDFLESVSYTVEATQHQHSRKLIITHTLKGKSFIAELLKNKQAGFSVALFYKDNAERQRFICDDWDYDGETNEIIAVQNIAIDFRYAPEIMPNIVIFEDVKITVDENSGLSDFWNGEIFDVPAHARIAYYSKLKFTSGDVSSLINVSCDENFKKGSIKTNVDETANEADQPIKIICAQDVFDELNKGVFDTPTDAKTMARTAIITQVLCHVYAYMNNLKDKETDIHSGLKMHMEMVKESTGEDWENELNASFAATQMIPYAIEALNKESK
jgi:hypothetical protein